MYVVCKQSAEPIEGPARLNRSCGNAGELLGQASTLVQSASMLSHAAPFGRELKQMAVGKRLPRSDTL